MFVKDRLSSFGSFKQQLKSGGIILNDIELKNKYKSYKSDCSLELMAEFDSIEHSDLFEEFLVDKSLDISMALLVPTSTQPTVSKNKCSTGIKKGFFNKWNEVSDNWNVNYICMLCVV